MIKFLIENDAGIYNINETPVIVSSRIRLARNLSDAKFISSASKDELQNVYQTVCNALKNTKKGKGAKIFAMSDLTESERLFLLECRLISKELCENKNGVGGVFMSKNLDCVVMVNEEDHLRIQSIQQGLSLDKIWQKLDEFDSELEGKLSYAFSEKYGYLTGCPSNAGTGMRASVMLHLPALEMSDLIEKIARGLAQLGIVIRGANGEGSESLGSMYQLSNQRTIGLSEAEIIAKVTEMAKKVESFELDARKKLLKDTPAVLFDKIGRAWGKLLYCELINSAEALECLSAVRLGFAMGYFAKNKAKIVNFLMLGVQCAHLMCEAACYDMTGEERDIFRALYIKEALGFIKDPVFKLDKSLLAKKREKNA